MNEVINIVLNKYDTLDLRKNINNKFNIFNVSQRNRDLIISYLLNSNNVAFLPYDPSKQLEKTPELGLSDIDNELSNSISTSLSNIKSESTQDFIRNILNTLRFISENFDDIFKDVSIDIKLFPQLL